MQRVFEPVFHVAYLATVITLGLIMALKARKKPEHLWFGVMAVTLGFGDAFHLIPRIIALATTGFESHAAALGFGKFVTSITMTFFYVILYALWKMRYKVGASPLLDAAIGILSVIRIALCFFPQNQWLLYDASLSWAIYRNIPFAIIGVIMIALFYKEGRRSRDANGVRIALAVLLSFGFYVPVVLWGQGNLLVGMLMVPKTLAYLWVVFIGFSEFRKSGLR